MSLDFAADIDAMLEGDLGVDVVIGDVEGRGFLDIESVAEPGQGMEYQRRATVLTVRSGVFPISNGRSVVADGVTYRIDEPQVQDDGKITRIILARGS